MASLQKQTNVSKKAKWAVFSRDKFNELVENIQKLMHDLVLIFAVDSMLIKEATLCEQEASELWGEETLPELQRSARLKDACLAEAIAKLARSVRTPVMVSLVNTHGITRLSECKCLQR